METAIKKGAGWSRALLPLGEVSVSVLTMSDALLHPLDDFLLNPDHSAVGKFRKTHALGEFARNSRRSS